MPSPSPRWKGDAVVVVAAAVGIVGEASVNLLTITATLTFVSS